MIPSRSSRQPAASPAAVDLTTELDRIAALDVDALRSFWRQAFQRPPPASLTRDMLARMLAYRIQEQHLGGLEPNHRKPLDRLAQGGVDDVRRLKIGTVLVREHQEVLHEVMVAPGGFQWQGTIYASLSTIAQAITGTAWNGPRFFGLRGKVTANPATAVNAGEVIPNEQAPRRGRRGAVRARDTGAGAMSTSPNRLGSRGGGP